jgi:hypothetical protein
VTAEQLLDAAVDVMHAALSSHEARRRSAKRGRGDAADVAAPDAEDLSDA